MALLKMIVMTKFLCSKKSARIQLVSKNIQLGSARSRKSASSAQLGKYQLGSARLSSPISSSVASLENAILLKISTW